MFHRWKILYCLLVLLLISCDSGSIKQKISQSNLPVSFKQEKVSLPHIYQNYINKNYLLIASKGYPKKGGYKAEYIYFRSLYHLKEWDSLLSYSKYANKKSPLYPYLVFYQLQALIAKNKYEVAYEFYKQKIKILNLNPYKNEINDRLEQILAALDFQKQSKNLARFFYYKYLQTKTKMFLLKAILNHDNKAIKILNRKNLFKLIPKSYYKKVAFILKKNKPKLALKIFMKLGNKKEIALIYYKQKRYKNAYKYFPNNHFLKINCKLKLKIATVNDIKKAEKYFMESYSFLMEWYLNQKKFLNCYSLLKRFYKKGYIRKLILSILHQKKYKKLKNYLLQFKSLPLSIDDYLTVHYWLGTILFKLKEKKQATSYFNYLATHYPFSYYGMKAFDYFSNKKNILMQWGQNFEKNKIIINKVLATEKSFPKSAKLGLFFLTINENKKGFKELKRKIKNFNYYNIAFIKFFKKIKIKSIKIIFHKFNVLKNN